MNVLPFVLLAVTCTGTPDLPQCHKQVIARYKAIDECTEAQPELPMQAKLPRAGAAVLEFYTCDRPDADDAYE